MVYRIAIEIVRDDGPERELEQLSRLTRSEGHQ